MPSISGCHIVLHLHNTKLCKCLSQSNEICCEPIYKWLSYICTLFSVATHSCAESCSETVSHVRKYEAMIYEVVIIAEIHRIIIIVIIAHCDYAPHIAYWHARGNLALLGAHSKLVVADAKHVLIASIVRRKMRQ